MQLSLHAVMHRVSAHNMSPQVEAHLSRALSVPVVRRHARGPADSGDGFHYGPAVRIVTGNFVTGKRRGVVDGVDFGATGSGGMHAWLWQLPVANQCR